MLLLAIRLRVFGCVVVAVEALVVFADLAFPDLACEAINNRAIADSFPRLINRLPPFTSLVLYRKTSCLQDQ